MVLFLLDRNPETLPSSRRTNTGGTSDVRVRPTTSSIQRPASTRNRCPLKDVENEVVSGMVTSATWVVVVPLLVVHRNPHLGRVAVVQTVAAAKIILSPKILGIVDVRIVIEAIPIVRVRVPPQLRPKARWSAEAESLNATQLHEERDGDQKMTNHHGVPPRDVRCCCWSEHRESLRSNFRACPFWQQVRIGGLPGMIHVLANPAPWRSKAREENAWSWVISTRLTVTIGNFGRNG